MPISIELRDTAETFCPAKSSKIRKRWCGRNYFLYMMNEGRGEHEIEGKAAIIEIAHHTPAYDSYRDIEV